MSDEAIAAFPDSEWTQPGVTKAFREAFDAGRASRDAEAWDGKWRTIPQSEEESRRVLKTWTKAELIDALTSARQLGLQKNEFWRQQMTARAEAAEAVIAAIADRHKPRNGESPRYAEDDYDHEREPIAWEKYTICDYDKTAWPCATQKLISAAPQTVLAERIAQAKAEALKEAALDLWRDESAGPGTTKATYNAIYATWLEQRATTVRAAVSHPEPTEEANRG